MGEFFTFDYKKVVRNIFFAGIAGAAGCSVLNYMQSCTAPRIAEFNFNGRVEKIMNALEKNDLALADKLKQEFVSKEELRPEDVIIIDHARERTEKRLPFFEKLDAVLVSDDRKDDQEFLTALEQSKVFSSDECAAWKRRLFEEYSKHVGIRLEKALETFDVADDQVVLAEMKDAGIDKSLIAQAENKIHAVSESGLFALIDATKGNDRIAAAEKYLTRFPKDVHAADVRKYLVIDRLVAMQEGFSSYQEVKDFLVLVKGARESLTPYVGVGPVGIDGLLPVAGVKEKVRATMDKLVDYDVAGVVDGMQVKVFPKDDNPTSWSAYLPERNKNFPQESVGVTYAANREEGKVRWYVRFLESSDVIRMAGEKVNPPVDSPDQHYEVEIKEVPKSSYVWTAQFFDGQHTNEAVYYADELKGFVSLDAIKKDRVQQEVLALEKLLDVVK
ncbi:MAG: hypothetical protein Q7R96_04805 [Nanoarchaeota archaeon]|nr:hypothetical protein [Nanoarchaeota archaeon]